MADACYLCRRTQADLDHLNEELRTRVYLSYFSNLRAQLDERQRRITFLQRLRDEEGADPHFRIGAAQVFSDPLAYRKLMPWIDTLLEVVRSEGRSTEVKGSIGELIESVLAEERSTAARMEDGLNRLRGGLATAGRSPLSLRALTRSLPVEWAAEVPGLAWRPGASVEREPLQRTAAGPPSVDVTIHLCTLCELLLGRSPS